MKRIYLTTFEKFLITFKSLALFTLIPFLNYNYIKLRDSLPNENL